MKTNQNDYVKAILMQLAEAYRRSRKDDGTNVINRRTALKPEKLYRAYRRNDGDPTEIEALNEAAQQCLKAGFIRYEMQRYSNEIETIYLEDSQIETIEAYLKEHYGYQSKHERMDIVRAIIRRYEGKSPAADALCQEMRESLEHNRIPANYEQKADILRALVFIENNTVPLYVREVSQMVYGSTKYFEEKTCDAVCRRLRSQAKRPCGHDEMLSEILMDHQIYPEQQRLCLKGEITLRKSGTLIEVSAFPGGIEFAAEELKDIETVQVHAQRFITVENKTAYYRCHERNTAFFYLGGYVNRTQRDFLKQVHADNPQLSFCHFGDIDAGGFYIHAHLCTMTGIPFALWHMSVQELRDPRYADCLQPLTAQDQSRLNQLAQKALYQDTVTYMLSEGVKLEQEIISFHMYGHKP